MPSKFFDVPHTSFETSQGNVDLPILYYEGSAVFVFFLVDTKRVLPKLKGTGLKPYPVFPGKTLAGIAAFEYRDSSIGSYNEVGIALLVYPEKTIVPPLIPLQFLKKSRSRNWGFYILDLPVTLASAHVAGSELWGYPKFVTDISFDLTDRWFECSVLDPEIHAPIMTVSGDLTPGIKLQGLDLVLFSHLQTSMLKTIIDVNATFKTSVAHGIQLQTGSSQHRMTQNLKELGLGETSPFLIQTSADFQSRLNAGERR
ncbi:acetoacetate decarboxylase family protein [Deltaproteobacteria bacterium TL4]